jgi:outer membrane immunogenic protein
MKRMFLAGMSALAVLTVADAVNAADLARRQQMPVKALVYAPVYNWSGFYVGINSGGAWGTSNWSNPLGSSSFNAKGGLIGGTAGYNWQMGRAMFGLEGDIDWSGIKGSGPTPCWLPAARPRTTGSAPSAVASATRLIACCLT